jgi:hypothetical protein
MTALNLPGAVGELQQDAKGVNLPAHASEFVNAPRTTKPTFTSSLEAYYLALTNALVPGAAGHATL